MDKLKKDQKRGWLADTFSPFSGGLNATITARAVSSAYTTSGIKQADTLMDVKFVIKDGVVESSSIITNEGATVGTINIRPNHISLISIVPE